MTEGALRERVASAYVRIRENEPSTIWIHLRPEKDVIAEAEAVQAAIDAGEELPLAGVTVAVKDNIDVAGLPTTAAHPASARIADVDAEVVARLRQAGALIIGKTNLDQFATGLVGTRSPYGAVASATDPTRVAGGSSSGSAAAVAHGLVDIALGTDTAGSGRVPAAFNRIIGLKPTLGLVPSTGVMPACPSYDTVSIFATSITQGALILRTVGGPAADDPGSRGWTPDAPLAAVEQPVIAVPAEPNLDSLSPGMRDAFDDAVTRLRECGAIITTLDISPLLAAAELLYGGALVAERAWSFGHILQTKPEGSNPSVAAIAEAAMRVPGHQVIADQQRLRSLTAESKTLLMGVDALVLPTAPLHPTMEQVNQDPLGVNSLVGTFTNFVNLMDMAAIAVPSATVPHEGELGITVVTPAFHDQVAADIASRFLGDGSHAPLLGQDGVDVAVFGVHMRSEPLNPELQRLGARYLRDIVTAPEYRMELVSGPIERPAVVRSAHGAEIPGELWRLPPAALGTLLLSIREPLGLGRIHLNDGHHVIGFIASTAAGHTDITTAKGWRGYRYGAVPVL